MVTYSNFTINLVTFSIIRILELDNKRESKRNWEVVKENEVMKSLNLIICSNNYIESQCGGEISIKMHLS